MMWYQTVGQDGDVAVSARVRLARNLAGFPFPGKMTKEQNEELLTKIRGAFAGKEGWEVVEMASLSSAERLALAEGHLVSRSFAQEEAPSLLIRNVSRSVYIMAPEEDHLRIQCITAGTDLRGAAEAVLEAERLLDEALPLAYSERYGYLTHCPSNLGTGMRASVMLHLPACTGAGLIRELAFRLGSMGLTIRGADGEGSAASAYRYQISNQVTLGIHEEEILETLIRVVGQIMEQERKLRERMTSEAREDLKEKVLRTYGILLYASRLTSAEIVTMYSDLRLAAAMGLIRIPTHLLDEMYVRSMPATVSSAGSGILTPAERDRARAAAVREILGMTGMKSL